MSADKRMTFFFDVVCPYAYLAAERISRLPIELRQKIDWQPVHLGGLLKHTQGPTNPMQAMSAARLTMNHLDLRRWFDRTGLPFSMPHAHPQRTTDAMRHLTTLDGEERERVARAYFRAYWSSGSVEHWEKVESSARQLLEETQASSSADQLLRQYTKHAFEIGACGVPSFLIDDALFWGQDRLFQALGFLTERPVDVAISLDPIKPQSPPLRVRFFHDFSSPFSYLGSTQIESLCAQYDVPCVKVPILLGALFRDIGTPDVPLFTFSEAKRAYMAVDLERFAEHWAVPFRFPTQFPLRTVTALRLSILEPSLTDLLYQWGWAENQDIGDVDALCQLLNNQGFDGRALLDGATHAEIKQALRDNTTEARDLGICGVPTFVIDFPDVSYVVWGQDRLCFVDWMLQGWRPRDHEERLLS